MEVITMPGKDSTTFDLNELNNKDIYKLLVSSIVPRPIAWVSSQGDNGIFNLAPFSFFTVASRNPPTLAISIEPNRDRGNTIKDTLANIKYLKEFVVNIVPEHLGEQMHESARNVEPELSEFELAGVTPMASQIVQPPMVQEAPIAFELSLENLIPIGTDQLILGKILNIRIDNSVYLGNYKIDIEKWKPLARLAGDYSGITKPYKLGKSY